MGALIRIVNCCGACRFPGRDRAEVHNISPSRVQSGRRYGHGSSTRYQTSPERSLRFGVILSSVSSKPLSLQKSRDYLLHHESSECRALAVAKFRCDTGNELAFCSVENAGVSVIDALHSAGFSAVLYGATLTTLKVGPMNRRNFMRFASAALPFWMRTSPAM